MWRPGGTESLACGRVEIQHTTTAGCGRRSPLSKRGGETPPRTTKYDSRPEIAMRSAGALPVQPSDEAVLVLAVAGPLRHGAICAGAAVPAASPHSVPAACTTLAPYGTPLVLSRITTRTCTAVRPPSERAAACKHMQSSQRQAPHKAGHSDGRNNSR